MIRNDPDASNDDAQHFDSTRRRVLLGATTALTGAIAGCSGGGGGDGGSGGGGDGGSDGSTGGGAVKESMGEVKTNAIEEFDILGWTSDTRDDIFSVRITFKNTGSETIDPEAYYWTFVAYDDADNEVDFSVAPEGTSIGGAEVDPGNQSQIYIEARTDDPGAVASYDIVVNCSTGGADGKYCPE